MKTDGLRVEYGKVEGLFNKMARAKGYGWISAVGSRSEGSGRRGTPIKSGASKEDRVAGIQQSAGRRR